MGTRQLKILHRPSSTPPPWPSGQGGGSFCSQAVNPATPPQFYFTLRSNQTDPALWEGLSATPVLLPASQWWNGRQLRRVAIADACDPLVVDCGSVKFFGDLPYGPEELADWVDQLPRRPCWVACPDLPCTPDLDNDPAEVRRRQRETLRLTEGALQLGAPWPSLPVVQGRTPAQYAAHARAYRRAGLVLPQMGVGSLLRRPPAEIAAICAAVRAELPDAELHLFGVGVRLLRASIDLTSIASFDSASWTKRFGSDLEPFKAVQQWTGWSQAKLAVRWALPRYQQSLAEASVSASKTAIPTACAA